ncbi:Per33p NDAI_0C06500 [Naumovozyma dairenensis CBS 421]|uniref:Pore and endoplasmic reticulum protein of 33 kDa n=1 Tax=Naumovozyma dairenensis (strain ATCC 10597 / BCRC 20456 / CBS 421 / NBRC 0211 / NRRL Y-12639) TaxID=1071378 RepID=G0W948_NAUDC|nr:hypothetical protein NDAI_0C06500 [Naumovozyma dairenensis CBS 421]CCD24309.1 hypothetical protein NDAI_0C06500 [Naumovozyma dairenensis CBS 421]
MTSNTAPQNARNTRPTAPFTTMLRSRIRQPQFYWFLGHLLTLYHFLRFHIAILSIPKQKYHYRMILLNISITYGIVLYQFIKSKQLQLNWNNLRQNLKTLDNLQYFIMLSTLLICSILSRGNVTINGASYGPVIFSLFHCLNYFKENLLPFLPISIVWKNLINTNISIFINNYNGKFLTMAQTLEILCALRLASYGLPIALLKTLIMPSLNHILSLLATVNYIWFFKLRFLQSQPMRLIMNEFIKKIDITVMNSNLPPNIKSYWNKYKSIVKNLFDKIPA